MRATPKTLSRPLGLCFAVTDTTGSSAIVLLSVECDCHPAPTIAYARSRAHREHEIEKTATKPQEEDNTGPYDPSILEQIVGPERNGRGSVIHDADIEDTNSTLPRRQLGRLLREAREGAGMTLEESARLMEWGKATLRRLERGQTGKLRIREMTDLGELYGLDDEKMAAIVGLAQQAPAKSWWHAYGDLIPAGFNLYVGLEAGARELAIYQPLIVPGLLQTPDYARTLDRTFFPEDSDEELNRRVDLRRQRQHILTRNRKPVSTTVVLQEAAIRTVVGNHRVMAAQTRHLADMSTRENIDLRILPYHAGVPLGMPLPPFVMLEFGRDARGKLIEPTVVFAENFTGGMYFEQPPEVRRYCEAFQKVHEASLDARPSRDVFREVAREYERER